MVIRERGKLEYRVVNLLGATSVTENFFLADAMASGNFRGYDQMSLRGMVWQGSEKGGDGLRDTDVRGRMGVCMRGRL